ncbi:MAG TPA: 7TM domain-containing protein [Vicinamibacterales bacterium]|jgi:hypothetical protein
MWPTDDEPLERSEAPAPTTGGWPLWLFLLIPLAIAVGKMTGSPVSALFSDVFSLAGAPKNIHRHLEYVFFVPLSAVVVSVFRLTLGLRVLGFFRPILLAIAFRVIGIPLGLAFLAVVLATVTVLWPAIRTTPYYARVPVLLSMVAAFLVIPVAAVRWFPAAWLLHLAYFPIIALCLISDSFAKLLEEKGPWEAAWRATTTIAAAVVITLVSEIHGAMRLPLRYPELLLAQVGCVLLLGRYGAWKLLDRWNGFAALGAMVRRTGTVVDASEATNLPADDCREPTGAVHVTNS